ncbi:MAG: Glycosyl transferase family 2 [Candidatus Magasanikbacteria bacterium GW2011_GWA2_56_11]|uniref:Glycosyl transferase family 2 n=1 Tax=Candidatus Magasanikbacteria bacterium GW2011_GWA2_56_11 TaxID=1619044 RepID=A0A0G2AKI0_9BACT|nr:MAG: Glycosyl transferase family 2 [Candidatus Magasanikbacteria bacterium GW2011_GWA2_56_11]
MTDITIVFVNLNMKDDILRAIRSIVDDTRVCPYQVKIVVADNSNNRDGVKEALEGSFPDVLYLDCGGNVGFGRGNTLGFQAAPARYYFALNRDTIIPENSRTIERLVRFMDDHPEIGCVGPKLLNLDGTLQYSCYRFDLPSILIKPLKQINWDQKYRWVRKYTNRLLMKDFDHNTTRPVDWVLGAAMIVRQEVVGQVGWFDERYFAYLEDCDWCRSMWEHGWPVYYAHDIIIRHAHARESSRVPGILKALIKNKTARIHLASWCKYLLKWRGKHKYYRY